jgi:inner membrane protein
VASIGHVAVGLLVGRAYEARSIKERVVALTSFGALALAPDADVLLTHVGADYHGQFGHRGFTHSLLFGVVLAAGAFFVARKWGTRPWLTALLTFLAVASHGLLDAMTYRTRGVPFFWPFTEERFTFPWRHIPPAPVGTRFLSQRGLEVAAVEFVYFLPITLGALFPTRATWRRWFQNIAVWRQTTIRLTAVVGLCVLSMCLANQYLRDSRLIAWIEKSTEKGVAVSLMDTPQFRHFH